MTIIDYDNDDADDVVCLCCSLLLFVCLVVCCCCCCSGSLCLPYLTLLDSDVFRIDQYEWN